MPNDLNFFSTTWLPQTEPN